MTWTSVCDCDRCPALPPGCVVRHTRGMPARVIVVGSINVDLVVAADRLPRPGETVLGGRFTQAAGGKGANAAVASARAGASVAMIGAVGDDAHGRFALDALVADGVDKFCDAADALLGAIARTRSTMLRDRINPLEASLPGPLGGLVEDRIARARAERWARRFMGQEAKALI